MRFCFNCDAEIPGHGYRRWVTTGCSDRGFAGLGRSGMRGGGSYTGLRTLCVDCAAVIDAKRRAARLFVGEAAILALALLVFFHFQPQIKAYEATLDSFLQTVVPTALFVFIGGALYLMPWIIGILRGATHLGALFLVNLMLGWTLMGWLVCLIWAARATVRQDAAP
jgi:Superinfection immunity protein